MPTTNPKFTNEVTIKVLHEDDDLLFVNKPPGLPIHPTIDPTRPNLWQLSRDYLKGAYLGLHHRLDRDCSGVVLFTKSTRANPGIADAFQNRKVQKFYVAVVADQLPTLKMPINAQPTEIKLLLKKIRMGGIGRMQVVKKGGDSAITYVSREGALVKAQLVTGRMHQIRVTLSWLGCPVVGDALYGSQVRAVRLMLHAQEMRIEHPITKKSLVITAPLPDDFKTALEKANKG
jgi:RluA family pseudouridine synthase